MTDCDHDCSDCSSRENVFTAPVWFWQALDSQNRRDFGKGVIRPRPGGQILHENMRNRGLPICDAADRDIKRAPSAIAAILKDAAFSGSASDLGEIRRGVPPITQRSQWPFVAAIVNGLSSQPSTEKNWNPAVPGAVSCPRRRNGRTPKASNTAKNGPRRDSARRLIAGVADGRSIEARPFTCQRTAAAPTNRCRND